MPLVLCCAFNKCEFVSYQYDVLNFNELRYFVECGFRVKVGFFLCWLFSKKTFIISLGNLINAVRGVGVTQTNSFRTDVVFVFRHRRDLRIPKYFTRLIYATAWYSNAHSNSGSEFHAFLSKDPMGIRPRRSYDDKCDIYRL